MNIYYSSKALATAGLRPSRVILISRLKNVYEKRYIKSFSIYRRCIIR